MIHDTSSDLEIAAGPTLEYLLLTVRDMGALLAMVESGLGVSMVPELALELRGRRLRALPRRSAVRTLCLLTRRGAEPTPAQRAFVSLLPLS